MGDSVRLLVRGVCLVGATLAPTAAWGQDIAGADSIVGAWVDAGRVPGAVLLVTQGGEPIVSRPYGSARSHDYGTGQYPDGGGTTPLTEPVPMTMETVFDLASVTKVMATTMAIMLLVDRGVLATDAPVVRYLPDFEAGDRSRITLEHLLTHRSGLPQWAPTYYHASDAAEAYDYVRGLPLNWEVGEERHYSDLGFMVLGRVVEAVTGQTLDGFLRAELYRPLGLRLTGFRGDPTDEGGGGPYAATSHGNPFERRMVHDADFGYRIVGDPNAWDDWRRYTLSGEVNDGNAYHAFDGVAGHAGLFSTAGELSVLLRLLLEGGEMNGRRYLSEDVVERFLTSTGEGQALGWQLPDYAPSGSFAHTGFTGTFVLGVQQTQLAVVLLTNRQNGGVDSETAYPELGQLQREITLALSGS